ncbi:MAG: hypothetical protein ACJ72D_16715 [Marmoricola sp.]
MSTRTNLRPDILRLVCAELPEPDATYVRSMRSDEWSTYVEAYSSCLRNGVELPAELHRALVAVLVGHRGTRAAAQPA